ncbi:MAG TPA: DUF222 domain-containing protein [Galbitalea sp.]|jgi:hypothetical protein
MAINGLVERSQGVRFVPSGAAHVPADHPILADLAVADLAVADLTATDLAATDPVLAFRAVVEALESVPIEIASYASLDEPALLEVNRLKAIAQRLLGGSSAAIAGEVARRSAPELGSDGLAQRAGYRTPEQFIKVTTGVTGREATTAVRIGRVLAEAEAGGTMDAHTGELRESQHPWLDSVAAAVSARTISVEAAEAIRVGLGEPNSVVTAGLLARVASRLSAEAERLDADSVLRRARDARDELDFEGVRLREAERHEQRSLSLAALPNGMTRLQWMMDTETAASVREVFDRLTSPKRGGVRFVGETDKLLAAEVALDKRSVGQLASDGFLQLLRQGADAGTTQLLGSGAPVVRVTVTRGALATRTGLGRIDGQADPLSIQTVERLVCGGAVERVVFDDTSGQPLDVGRSQRLFTARQREALAVRDGGCRMPECDRPPSWTEAHHIKFWSRDHGESNTADGILLCRHHHLLCHNAEWEIERDDGGRYWLVRPHEGDPQRARVLMPGKSAAMRDLMGAEWNADELAGVGRVTA